MTVFFNENDAFAAQWLRNLYPSATVDDRSIKDVLPADVMGFRRVHFFAGIAGWQYALDLAGWGDAEVWTGSAPCQPFSAAGKRKGEADERHLWPEFFRLIAECRPGVVFGEQVASADGLRWIDGVFADLESAGYSCWACDSCAAGVGAPHIRQRLFWVAHAQSKRAGSRRSESQRSRGRRKLLAGPGARIDALDDSSDGRLADADGGCGHRKQHRNSREMAGERGGNEGQERKPGRPSQAVEDYRADGGLADTRSEGPQERIGDGRIQREAGRASEGQAVELRGSVLIPCRDGKTRRVSAKPGDEPLANAIPRDLGRSEPELRSLAKRARANRIGRLRGYGNSIIPQLAAEFIRAFMEAHA